MPLIKEKHIQLMIFMLCRRMKGQELIDGQIYYGTTHEKASGCFDGAFGVR